MFFYVLCALLLLNAFSTEAEECSDKAMNTRAGGRFCDFMTTKNPEGEVLCTAKGYEEIAKEYCAKTCSLCQ